MLDDSVIARRGRHSAPFGKKPKEDVMRNWSAFGLIAAVLTLAASPFLIHFGNDYFEQPPLAEISAPVPETKLTASPLLSSMKTGKRAEEEAPKPEAGDMHVAERGDVLERLVGRKNASVVATMSGVTNPDRIKVGQTLLAPVGVKFHRRGFRVVDCSQLPQGECKYSHPGADKMCGGRDPLKALTSDREYGLTTEQALQVTTADSGERVLLPAGTTLNGLSFEHGFWHGRIVTTVPMWVVRKAEIDGNVYLQFDACCNLGRMSVPPKPQVPPPAEPIVEEFPPEPVPPTEEPVPPSETHVEPPPEEPDVPVEPPQMPEESPEEEARPSCFEWDWFLGTGGDDTGTRYSHTEAAAYLLCKEGENGKHYFGLGLKGSIADGATDTGFGWDGREKMFGLAHKYVSHDGWDVSSKLLWGELEENGSVDLYKSQRRFDLVGVSLAYNNYERYLRGEKRYPEWNAYFGIFFPTSSDVKHSWDGTPIEDTEDLERFDYKLGVGARQYLYAGEDWWPFVSGGLSVQHPTSKTGNLRIGVTDANKIVFASVGVNHNFDDGENAFGWDLGVDMARGIKFARAEARRAEMLQKLEENGVMVDEDSGIAFVATSDTKETKSAKPARKPAKASVWESPWDFER